MENNIITNQEKIITSKIGEETISSRLSEGEKDINDIYERITQTFSSNKEHKNQLKKYLYKKWFIPSTPILANGGANNRGLPISCFIGEIEDSMHAIIKSMAEYNFFSFIGGGVGSYMGKIRAIGEKIHNKGVSNGIIPIIKAIEHNLIAIAQAPIRRGSCAIYIDYDHPEIYEFINIRNPMGGVDQYRKALDIHHGIILDDKFINAVENNQYIDLISRVSKMSIKSVLATDIWSKILISRLETGAPFMFFYDNVQRMRPEILKKLNLNIKLTNLCTEITLPTGRDHLNNFRTAICCLSSLNLEKYDEWCNNFNFILDIMRFMDNVINVYIDNCKKDKFKNFYANSTIYSAQRDRSIGLGAMGFHSYLQNKSIEFGSTLSKEINIKIFKNIKDMADKASKHLSNELGACLDSLECNKNERFTHKIAIAPTTTISNILNTSPGIDPYYSNTFIHKTINGTFMHKNKNLEKLIHKKYKNNQKKIWEQIIQNNGSIQNISLFDKKEKAIYKTAFELNQHDILDLAIDRGKYICQSQSLNLFCPPNINKRELHNLHLKAAKNLKTLYYLKSYSQQRAGEGLVSDFNNSNININ